MKQYFPIILLGFIFSLSIVSCKKKAEVITLDNYEYLIFGAYQDSCIGDCVTYFKLENNEVYRDNIFSGINVITFSSQPLGAQAYNTADNVLEQFPVYLNEHPNQKFGCPDCYGQGGYLLKIKKDGKEITWHFDQNNSNNAEVVRNYVLRLRTAIKALE